MESKNSVYRTEDFSGMEQRFRTQLINSMPGIKALNLVGTRSAEGEENLAVFNSIFHVGANPPYLGMVIRPDSVDRHTWQNIQSTGSYTLNSVGEEIYRQAHQTSARYERGISEFEAVGLDAQYRDGVTAPFVAESAIKIGLELQEFHRVECNGTLIVIGKVVYVEIEDALITNDGSVDLVKAQSVGSIGVDGYVGVNWLSRLSYAKPDKKPITLMTK
jgi:flavin reductase (DIM6/NTAB) family NADH-FMN oxidoreductase RutF